MHAHTQRSAFILEACVALVPGQDQSGSKQKEQVWGQVFFFFSFGRLCECVSRAVKHTGSTGASPPLAVGRKTKGGVIPTNIGCLGACLSMYVCACVYECVSLFVGSFSSSSSLQHPCCSSTKAPNWHHRFRPLGFKTFPLPRLQPLPE